MRLIVRNEWEGRLTRVVAVSGLPSPRGRFPTRYRPVDAVYVTATCGPRAVGDAAVEMEHSHAVYGRGLAGVPWAFLVPSVPAVIDGRAVVYRLHDDSDVTPHTRGRWDDSTISVAVCGTYRSRHDDGLPTRDTEIDPSALAALDELASAYLLPRLGLPPTALRGPWDAGEPAEAGDALETWTRRSRGERVVDWASTSPSGGPLKSWTDRLDALRRLGATLPSHPTPHQIADAIEAVCRSVQAPPQRRWSTDAERAVRVALGGLASESRPLLSSHHGTASIR